MATHSAKPMVQDGFDYREMTEAEFAQYQIDQIEVENTKEVELLRAANKASAESKLKALGLTDAEIVALLG